MDSSEPDDLREHMMDHGLVGGVRALVEDARTLAEAEFAYRKAQAAYAWKRGKGIALLLVLALFFLFFSLMALVVGLLLALAPLLTAWGAMAAVSLGLLALCAGFALSALSRVKQAKARLLDEGSEG